MSSKRPVVLMVILLVLVAVSLGLPLVQQQLELAAARRAQEPLPGTNALTHFKVERTPEGRWFARGEYFYTGEPKHVNVQVMQSTGPVGGPAHDSGAGGVVAQRGSHHFSVELRNSNLHEMRVTQRVWARMFVPPAGPALATASHHLTIQWPDWVTAKVDAALSAGQPQQVVDEAVTMIDTNHTYELQRARSLLQKLVEKSPRTDSAYVELARVAMKTNWNADGRANAEALIKTALEIAPDSVNARILLGYVFAHQGRHKEAEALFVEAAAANPPNLWLWTNWGEVLAMQGRIAPAIAKYREAVARPPTGNTYDRAREDAYDKLLPLLALRKDMDGMEAAYRQRAQEYGSPCNRLEYGRFLVLHRADPDAALAQLRDIPASDCDAMTRRIRGLAHYVRWAQGQDPGRAELLHQARAFMPVSPQLLRTLASSERTVGVIQQLAATGAKLGMQDAQQLDALAYALRDGDMDAARRLLKLGARPDALVGPEQMPVALLPVVMRNFEGIRVMQRAGVDYKRLRFQGSTALDHAQAQGDRKLLQQLDPKAGSL